MSVIATLTAKLGLDASGFQSGLNKVESESKSFGSRAGGFLSNAFSFATGGAILNGVSAIGSSIKGVAGAMLAGNGEFERYNNQFTTLLGSSEAAKQRMAELAQFGAETPFELPDVVKADQILTNFGLHAENAKDRFGFSAGEIQRIAGDAASGVGIGFDEMSTYLGKFSAGSTGEVISRFQELGIVTKQQLTEMGLSFDKGGALIINSQAEMDKATGILMNAMKNKYGGLMDKQSKTFEGMLSNLQDWKDGTIRTLGAPIFEVVKDKLAVFLEFLNKPETKKTIEKIAGVIANGLGKAIDWLANTGIPGMIAGWKALQPVVSTFLEKGGEVAGFIKDNLKPILAGLAVVFGAVVIPAFIAWAAAAGAAALSTMLALAPIVIPIVAIGAAVALLVKAWDSDWGGIRTTLTNFWEDTAKPIFEGVVGFFTTGIPNAINDVKNAFNGFVDMGASFLDGLRQGISNGWTSFTGWFLGNLASIIPGGTATLSALGITLPGRALGGQVVAGQAYTVGELGRETFVPSVSGTIVPAGAGGGSTVVINVAGSVISERDLAQTIREQLLASKQRNGSVGLA
ncbi:hypothetical protein SE17_02295 [Kouleothrix aurantiaca]|uniref:Phage tail tape measure protein domain-containing protein n=1 Tax=Kouleothrix aurantiaca TaxID=186479 RepID=A0A0P9DXK7_9CHLR|nr:hypothetical protein SE17_02295 [Kouleothrix aurantiaca]